MKILLVSNMYPSTSNPYAGVFIKNQFEKISQELNAKDEVSLFKMNYTASSSKVTALKYIWAYIRFLPYLFKRFNIVHVHYFGYLAPIANLYKFFHSDCKLVVTFHGSDINKDMPESGLKNRLFKKLLSRFDQVIASGKSLYKPLERKFNIHPSFTLCAGVDRNVFYPEVGGIKDIDFLVVGSFVKVKGLDVFKSALVELDRNDLRVCFVGHGPEEELVKSIAKYAQIQIIPNVTQDELRRLYNRARYLFFPSKNDAFGLVVTESIYSGTPVIVNRTGGAEEQVIDEVNGFVYEKHDPKEMALLMRKAIGLSTQEYNQLSENCINTNHEYSLSEVVRNTIDIYSNGAYRYKSVFKLSFL